MAHAIANDVVRQFTGKPGPFLTRIIFSSDRDGGRDKELYVMDYDGENQRRITFHRSLSIAPDWSYDGDKIVYQSFVKHAPRPLLVLPRLGDAKPDPGHDRAELGPVLLARREDRRLRRKRQGEPGDLRRRDSTARTNGA